MFGRPISGPLEASRTEAEDRELLAWRQETGGLVAGYTGSLRYSDGAFRPWPPRRSGARRRSRPCFSAAYRRRQLQFFGDRAVVLPFVGYEAYAAALGALQPDILIAPLDRSRTSMSKCPIKYLDYSIAGAAGVYSDMPPYAQTVVDGRDGASGPRRRRGVVGRGHRAAGRRRGLAAIDCPPPPAATCWNGTRRAWSRRPSPRPCGA